MLQPAHLLDAAMYNMNGMK